MGLFGETKYDVLQKCTLKKLKQISEEKKVKIECHGIFRSKIIKEDYVTCIDNSNKVSMAYVKRVLKGEDLTRTGMRVGKKMSVPIVAKAIKNEFPLDRRHDRESEHERDFKRWCQGRFGSENVTTQYSVGRTRIDVVVGGVGIELKMPRTPRQLMTLRGQVDVYKNHFGKNILIVLLPGGCDYHSIDAFKTDMKKKGITVIEKR